MTDRPRYRTTFLKNNFQLNIVHIYIPPDIVESFVSV